MTNNDLCISLAKCEAEDEVIRILKSEKYWDNETAWRNFGDNENNFATIGNQQSLPETALVEKIINSVDAVLMSECLKRGIDPESSNAPQSISKALEEYFQIKDGKLSNITSDSRTKLANRIALVATGKKSNPCYTIVDVGEGQIPARMPDTLLSIAKSNKLRIPFVQGKFNMGGTGVLRFCGKNNFQLIISKRNTEILKNEKNDDSWGFTLVRRFNPKESMRSSVYKYLAPQNNVLTFKADTLPILPGDYPNPYGREFECGTYIKLYEYQMTGYKTNILFDLYNRLSLLMPNVALPVRFYERRPGYAGHSLETTLAGLSVRLEEDKRENLEPGFPSSSEMYIRGHKMKVSIFAFKKGASEKYTKSEGIVFTINGQTHGAISKTFFNRRNVGLGYLADSILLLIDCTNFGSSREKEDLFMNSRDRLASGEIKNEIERNLEDLLKNHQGLRELKEKRRREDISDQLKDSKPLVEILQDIINKSPTLSLLFSGGNILSNPFKLMGVATKEEYHGKKFPTYFKLTHEYNEGKPKVCHINKRFRVEFETDAANDYLDRDNDPGTFSLKLNGNEVNDFAINLWNGTAHLTCSLPSHVKIGNKIKFETCVNDISRIEPFCEELYIEVHDEINTPESPRGERKKPPSKDEGRDAKANSGLSLPNIFEVREDDWSRHGFDKESSLKIVNNGDEGYDFFINMDNIHLLRELKNTKNNDAKLLESRYKYAIALIGVSLVHFSQREEHEETISDDVLWITKAISTSIMPIIECLGSLKIEELEMTFEEVS